MPLTVLGHDHVPTFSMMHVTFKARTQPLESYQPSALAEVEEKESHLGMEHGWRSLSLYAEELEFSSNISSQLKKNTPQSSDCCGGTTEKSIKNTLKSQNERAKVFF